MGGAGLLSMFCCESLGPSCSCLCGASGVRTYTAQARPGQARESTEAFVNPSGMEDNKKVGEPHPGCVMGPGELGVLGLINKRI